MSKMRAQRGVGMVEVLVALLLLAIGVLGFTALQLRAVSASMEASNQVLALNLARDLTERMRANPQATQCKLYHTEVHWLKILKPIPKHQIVRVL